MTKVCFWDIDGTLLTTGRAGIFAWEQAVQKLFGEKIELQKLSTAGLTDFQVAMKIMQSINILESSEFTAELVGLYEKYLPTCLPLKKGKVLDGVFDILDAFRDDRSVVSILLTGNTRIGAMTKLSYYGLDSYFKIGSFSENEESRVTIAQNALSLAQDVVNKNSDSVGNTYVIGDTPHDIHCGKAIGARVIAVATGGYHLEKLQLYNPWWAIECLPDAAQFISKISQE